MTTTVFLVVLFAALLHASWNALVKGGQDKMLSLAAVMIGHVPCALLCFFFVPLPKAESLPFLAVGVIFHVGYCFFLMQSYKLGDLTQVYPLARGSAPLIVTLVSVLVLNVALSKQSLIGIFMIGAGIVCLAFVRRSDGVRNLKAYLYALGTGCFIASYSLVDGLGARLSGSSVSFYSWLSIGNAIVIAIYLQCVRPTALREVITDYRRVFIIGGTASFIAYALVTWAFTQAPIAVVTALRETSIVFALGIGVVFLKERFGFTKLLATVVTLGGVLMLRLAN